MHLGEPCRLRIVVTRGHQSAVDIGEITSICIEAPDEDAIELEKRILIKGPTRCEAVALMDLAALHSPALHQISPAFGTVDERYAKLDVHLRLESESGGEMKLTRRLAVKVVHPADHLFYYRFLSTFRHLWDVVQSWWTDAAQFFVSRVSTAIDAQ